MKRNRKNNPLFSFFLISKILYFLILNFFPPLIFKNSNNRILKNFYDEFSEKNFIFITILLKNLFTTIIIHCFIAFFAKNKSSIYEIFQEGCMVGSVSGARCVRLTCLNILKILPIEIIFLSSHTDHSNAHH